MVKDRFLTGRFPGGNVEFHALLGECASSCSIGFEKTSGFV